MVGKSGWTILRVMKEEEDLNTGSPLSSVAKATTTQNRVMFILLYIFFAAQDVALTQEKGVNTRQMETLTGVRYADSVLIGQFVGSTPTAVL
jgi:hypothetical protein